MWWDRITGLNLIFGFVMSQYSLASMLTCARSSRIKHQHEHEQHGDESAVNIRRNRGLIDPRPTCRVSSKKMARVGSVCRRTAMIQGMRGDGGVNATQEQESGDGALFS